MHNHESGTFQRPIATLHNRLVSNHINVDLEVNIGIVLSLAEPKPRGNIGLKVGKRRLLHDKRERRI